MSTIVHRIGSIYRNADGFLYILAAVDGSDVGEWISYALISLTDGNRWNNPIKVYSINSAGTDLISDQIFQQVSEGCSFILLQAV